MRIKSPKAVACFQSRGAEISSFKKSDGSIEYMWQGDPKYWKGRNPILFPIVGNTYSKTYQIDGRTYAMGNHGLTRHMDFELIAQTADSLTFSVTENEETLKQYPFRFRVTVCYHLIDTQLNIDYEICNTDQRTMPFTFGLHPAFNVPLAEGNFSDYRLIFEKEENPLHIDIDGSRKRAEPFSIIALDYELFQRYPTLMYSELKSDYVRLSNGREGIEVGIKGFTYLAFWCGNRAPFLCIEPWYGIDDFKENDLPFEKREGMMQLESGKSFRCGYYLKLLEEESYV